MHILEPVWRFLQDQILGMKWLDALLGNALSLVGLNTASRVGGEYPVFPI